MLTGRAAASIEDGVHWIRQTVALLGVPRLRTHGLRAEHTADIAAKAAKASSMQGNPVVLDEAELSGILAEAV